MPNIYVSDETLERLYCLMPDQLITYDELVNYLVTRELGAQELATARIDWTGEDMTQLANGHGYAGMTDEQIIVAFTQRYGRPPCDPGLWTRTPTVIIVPIGDEAPYNPQERMTDES